MGADLDPAWVEAVAKALGDHYFDTWDDIKVDGVWTWGYCCDCGENVERVKINEHLATGVLAAVIPLIQAQALRDAADAYNVFVTGRDGYNVRTWLNERADALAPSPKEQP